MNFPKARQILPDYGLLSNGAARLPVPQPPDCPILLDDAVLPQKWSEEAIALLAEHGRRGIVLDFEREPSALHGALAGALRSQLAAQVPIYAPTQYLNKTKNIFALRACPDPCNSWENFCRAGGYPRWLLELTPWNARRSDGGEDSPVRFLPGALCFTERHSGVLTYFDTQESLLKKLDTAQKYGCIGAVGIWEEFPKK